MPSERGREKLQSSPDATDKKKRGSLFRRASLSRKKNRDEASKRAKSRDRPAADTVDLINPATSGDLKKKSSSLPRETKSPFVRDRKSKRDSGRRKTLDLDTKVESLQLMTLKESVARSSCQKLELPEVVGATIGQIQKRGLQEQEIYRVPAPKVEVLKILKMYGQMDDVDLSKVDIHVVAASLKIFINNIPGNLLDCMKDKLEDLTKDVDEFLANARSLLDSKLFPRENYNICSWLFTHLNNVVQCGQNNQSTDSLTPIWCPNLNMSKDLFFYLVTYSSQLFGKVNLDPGRLIIRWKDSSTNLEIPNDVSLDWIKEEIEGQEKVLAKLHNLERPDSHTEERMWEVQRIKTALKRKHKQIIKEKREQEEKEMEEMRKLLEEEHKVIIEQEELIKMQNHLRRKLDIERAKVDILRSQQPMMDLKAESSSEDDLDEDQLVSLLDELVKENDRLESQNTTLVDDIYVERKRLVNARIEYRIKNELTIS